MPKIILIAHPGTITYSTTILQGQGMSWWELSNLIICVEFRKLDGLDLIIYVECQKLDGSELEGLVLDVDLVIYEIPYSSTLSLLTIK